MSAETREELSPDENRLLNKARDLYDRAVDTAAASRRIVSVDDPRVVLARDGFGKPIEFGGKVPAWSEIQPSREELAVLGKLEEPVGVISIPALSLKTQAAVARTLEQPLQVRSNWDLGADESDDLVEFRPENPKKARTKANRLRGGIYTGDGIDVVFQDGGPEVPDSTLGLDAFDMRELCKEQGLIQPDVDMHIALQLEGARRGKQFDSKRCEWLDAYLKSVRATVVGSWFPNDQKLYLGRNDPEFSDPGLGGRRAVRVKKKS